MTPHTPLNGVLEGLEIITSEGDLWKRQRLFLHEKFRALSVKLWPNTRFEKDINMEIEELFTELNDAKGQVVNPAHLFGKHIHNVICQLMMSLSHWLTKPMTKLHFVQREGLPRLFGQVLIGEHIEAYLKLEK